MNIFEKSFKKFNEFQQRHNAIGFPVAVIKKYGDDQAGHKAALFTYYAFLSLFPLLLLLTTFTNDIVGSHSVLGGKIINSLNSYFPLLGNQLSSHVHTLHKSGLPLAVGILFTIYGTRGVADAFRHGVQDIWMVKKSDRDGFPASLFRSFGLIVIGGLGFIAASIISGLALVAGQGLEFRILSIALNLVILFWLFQFLLNFSLPRHVRARETSAGAATMAFGLVILQLLGNYILKHELKSLDALYSYFALALGLLFWLYLQAQILFYAVEIAVVSNLRLYPRSLNRVHTPADDRLAELKI